MTKECKGKCETASHKLPKEKTKTRVQELQGRVNNTKKIARKEDPTAKVAILVEQTDRMLGGCGAELNDPSPASCLHGGSHGNLGSFSKDLAPYLIQQCDEKDDAESALKQLPQPNPEGPEPNLQNPQSSNFTDFTGNFIFSSKGPPEDIPPEFDLDHNDVPNVMPEICPPASAFSGPTCAFWECSRPAQVLCQDYCSGSHAFLGKNEGLPGNTPVVRPGGINLKDGSLFAALNAKTQGKDVGIPNYDGAATRRSPWNDSELFDLSLLEGEKLREWLFFGRPRRAFESGNRKQRSLPDYSGRGWHESRKQVMREFGGQKRSYYMDPQPSSDHEWHLFEYEVNSSDACALYRLELKFGRAKKSSKGKVSSDPLADLQKMGRLTAEASTEVGNNSKGKASKRADAGNIFGSDYQTTLNILINCLLNIIFFILNVNSI